LLSQFSRRFCTAALQSCSTVNALCSDAIVGFLGWPPASPAPPGVRNLPRWLCSRPSVASSRPPCLVRPKGAVSLDSPLMMRSSITRLEETKGCSAPAAAPLRPLASPQQPPARFAPRLRCPLAGLPTTRSSFAGLEEMKDSSAPVATLGGYRAPWPIAPRHWRALYR
jgi:hypothetical protein